MSKEKEDADFIEKIKTITFSAGPKGGNVCEKCGEPESKHIQGAIIPIPMHVAVAAVGAVAAYERAQAKQKASSEEAAFSA